MAFAAQAAIFTGLAPTALHAAAPDAIQFSTTIEVPANATGGIGTIGTVPAGKRMIIQTISIYREGAVAGSIAQPFVSTVVNSITGYIALPQIIANGVSYPASTQSGTFYADAGTMISASLYRTGTATAEEADQVTVTGYLVAQ